MSLDKIAAKIAALGVPGLILVIVMVVSGYGGAAAITFALSTLGGPWGMLGGLVVLGLLVLVSNAIGTYGAEEVVRAVVKKLKKDGLSKEEVLKKVESYPISMSLKLKIKDYIEKFWDEM